MSSLENVEVSSSGNPGGSPAPGNEGPGSGSDEEPWYKVPEIRAKILEEYKGLLESGKVGQKGSVSLLAILEKNPEVFIAFVLAIGHSPAEEAGYLKTAIKVTRLAEGYKEPVKDMDITARDIEIALGRNTESGLGAVFLYENFGQQVYGTIVAASAAYGMLKKASGSESKAASSAGAKSTRAQTKYGDQLAESQYGKAAQTEKSNWPKTREELAVDLETKGFEFKGKSPAGYETYKGPDGRTVTVKPDGEVISVQKVWKSDGSGKFSQRQDYDGRPLPGQPHSTGYYVE